MRRQGPPGGTAQSAQAVSVIGLSEATEHDLPGADFGCTPDDVGAAFDPGEPGPDFGYVDAADELRESLPRVAAREDPFSPLLPPIQRGRRLGDDSR